MMKLCILGRQADLSLAELEALGTNPKQIGPGAALAEFGQELTINRLGGTLKVCDVIAELPQKTSSRQLETTCAQYLATLELAKLNFGVSWYGTSRRPKGFEVGIKKQLKGKFNKIRFVLPKDGQVLNSAAVFHNALHTTASELVIVEHPSGYVVAATVGVQDIDAYTKRDYHKPCRDSHVGMLPPKLSQILINLAAAGLDETIVDPFCGSGGLLMEAALMGYGVVGSDNDPKMVACSRQNLEWTAQTYNLDIEPSLTEADALEYQAPDKAYAIVTEGYLGHNFYEAPGEAVIASQQKEVTKLYIDFLKRLATGLSKPTRVVLCVPAWFSHGKTYEINLLDQVSQFGYTKHKFRSADTKALLYHRVGQFVGRQILVLTLS